MPSPRRALAGWQLAGGRGFWWSFLA